MLTNSLWLNIDKPISTYLCISYLYLNKSSLMVELKIWFFLSFFRMTDPKSGLKQKHNLLFSSLLFGNENYSGEDTIWS